MAGCIIIWSSKLCSQVEFRGPLRTGILSQKVSFFTSLMLFISHYIQPLLSHKTRAQTCKCIRTMPSILETANIHALLASVPVCPIPLCCVGICCSRLERIPTSGRQLHRHRHASLRCGCSLIGVWRFHWRRSVGLDWCWRWC